MTKSELAAAFRERFCRLRSAWPELCAIMQVVSDERVLEGHVRCGACKGFHLTVDELVAQAAELDDMDALMAWTQAHAERHWPKACLRRIHQIELGIRAERN